MEFSPNRKHAHAFAIIRVDHFHGPETSVANKVTVKLVVRTESRAAQEVARLNSLRKDTTSVEYLWQVTRLEAEDESPEQG